MSDIELLRVTATNHHLATHAIVQKLIQRSYEPRSFPVIFISKQQPFVIIDATNQIPPDTRYIEPYITMGSFSIELNLKLLIFLEKNQLVYGHDLSELYIQLTDESKKFIQLHIKELVNNSSFHKDVNKFANDSGVDFSWNISMLLKKSSQAFKKWRYPFEKPDQLPWFAGYSEIQSALNARIAILEKNA